MQEKIQNSPLSEREFNLLKKGNPRVFEKFYRSYRDCVYRFILNKTGRKHHFVDDILSETFYSALRSVSKLRSNENLRAWILQIAHRRYMDFVGKSCREQKILEAMKKKAFLQDENSYENLLIQNEKVSFFKRAIQKIKPNYSRILDLKYIQLKTQKEIALLLDKHEKAVGGLIHRAKTALKCEIFRLYRHNLR